MRQLATGLAVTTTLGLVFAAYLDPHTVVDLSTRFWACIG